MDPYLFLILGIAGLALLAAERRGIIDVEDLLTDDFDAKVVLTVVLLAVIAAGPLVIAARRRTCPSAKPHR